MIISRVKLKNWRNFREVDIQLGDRVFIVGPNASGKSNFLDVFRFLRDIVKSGGGLQKAIEDRGGLSKVRCLAARKDPAVEIDVHLSDTRGQKDQWRYSLSIIQKTGKNRRTYVQHETVYKNGIIILNRPEGEDERDELRLTQTALEQVNANVDFRDIAVYFESVLYLHLIPQLLRHPKEFVGAEISEDPFGRKFLERLAKTSEKTRTFRLKEIEKALRIAVPHLTALSFVSDSEEGGVPHLEVLHTHWRPNAGFQREDQFSDGTLRLIGLLWSLMEGESLLLLEEPELSLHAEIVKRLSPLMHRLLRKKKRQVILSTHSAELLSDRGIGAEEVLLFIPETEGTRIQSASAVTDIALLLNGGMSMAEAVEPYTAPPDIMQLDLFG